MKINWSKIPFWSATPLTAEQAKDLPKPRYSPDELAQLAKDIIRPDGVSLHDHWQKNMQERKRFAILTPDQKRGFLVGMLVARYSNLPEQNLQRPLAMIIEYFMDSAVTTDKEIDEVYSEEVAEADRNIVLHGLPSGLGDFK